MPGRYGTSYSLETEQALLAVYCWKQSASSSVVADMDMVAIIAERKIEEGLQSGAFGMLPERGRIECTIHGEAFFAWWFRDRYASDDATITWPGD